MASRKRAERGHDHESCIARALSSADELCAGGGARLTDLRRKVLRIVWRGHDAVKAYDIIDRLNPGRRSAKPPTVYRTLQFLLDQGLVHRLESLNAFVGCPAPERPHECEFLICDLCGWVREFQMADVRGTIADRAEVAGFLVDRQTIEVFGTCANCREAQA